MAANAGSKHQHSSRVCRCRSTDRSGKLGVTTPTTVPTASLGTTASIDTRSHTLTNGCIRTEGGQALKIGTNAQEEYKETVPRPVQSLDHFPSVFTQPGPRSTQQGRWNYFLFRRLISSPRELHCCKGYTSVLAAIVASTDLEVLLPRAKAMREHLRVARPGDLFPQKVAEVVEGLVSPDSQRGR